MRRLRDVSELVGAIALFIVMALIFASVVARQVFGFIISDSFDFSRMFLGVVVFWGIASAVAAQSLITADFLYQALAPRGRRILDVAGSLVTFAILAILCWRIWLAVIDAFGNHIRTQDIGIPLWYFYAVAATAFFAALIFAARNTVFALLGRTEDTE